MTQGLTSPVKKFRLWTSLVVQWLRHCTSTAEGMGPILGGGTKIPYAQWCNNKKEGKNQDFCLGQAISEMPGGTW